MITMLAIQVIAVFKTSSEAKEALEAQAIQDGYLGGRVLPSTPEKPGWKVQTFFEDPEPDCWLPDDTRHVIIPESTMRAVGIIV